MRITQVNNTSYIHLRNLKTTPVTYNTKWFKICGVPFGKVHYHELPWIKHMPSTPFKPQQPFTAPTRLQDVLFGPSTAKEIGYIARLKDRITLMPGEAAMIFLEGSDQPATAAQNATAVYKPPGIDIIANSMVIQPTKLDLAAFLQERDFPDLQIAVFRS